MNLKSTDQPPYTITPEILNQVAAISEAVGPLTVLADQTKTLRLRRINRVRTIHGSLGHPHGLETLYGAQEPVVKSRKVSSRKSPAPEDTP